jgi:exopolyphosphatase/guanosine-5'-triphosphate,3'-diphosphate pyrophosphatase
LIRPVGTSLQQQGWDICVSACGTIQTLQEIMHAQGMDEIITLSKLRQFKQRVLQCSNLEALDMAGLTPERAMVFPGGLAILIAIFQEMQVKSIILSGGALREGLIYDMLSVPVEHDIRGHTLHHLQQRYLLDSVQAQQVSRLAQKFVHQTAKEWQLDSQCQEILHHACLIHEIGLSINVKQAPQHAAWMVRHLDLPGFTPAQQLLLAAMLQNQSGAIDTRLLHQQNVLTPQRAQRLCRLLRLAILFTRRGGASNNAPAVNLRASGNRLTVILPAGWLKNYPLSAEKFRQEVLLQRYVRWPLVLEKQQG